MHLYYAQLFEPNNLFQDAFGSSGVLKLIGLQATDVPDKVLKELDKRRIIGSSSNIAEAYRGKSHHRRRNSWDNGNNALVSPDTLSPLNGQA